MEQLRYPYRNEFRRSVTDFVECVKWVLRFFPARRPDLLKRRVVASYAKQFHLDIFVESGTYLGATVDYLSNYCASIYSVECQQRLWERAVERFAGRPNITILHGSGSELMPTILKEFDQPALFWLDGHFASGTTAPGEVACPTQTELRAILSHRADHVILIDDADEFRGHAGYPSIEDIEEDVRALRPEMTVIVAHNIIRIVPAQKKMNEFTKTRRVEVLTSGAPR